MSVSRNAGRWQAGTGAACLAFGLALLGNPPAPVELGALPAPSTPSRPVVTVSAASPAGTIPTQLELPAGGVSAPVVPVATGADGALVVPDAPSTVGWWSPSSLAGGRRGTTVIAGHVDSAAEGMGVLSVLRRARPGDEVVLRGAEGREVRYAVVAVRQYTKAELPPEVFSSTGPPQLVLITCGGRFDKAARHYTDNVVVHAVPVG
ncbi:class F sortase [Pseudonocardia sp. TRM90224]|uniref:class F sortase n=1 Tax=Pseudonocardia sp. TRM90224 TaxID=2812678 RepID=UPI001E3E7955|nr:class F sortase [Pseudonocardia sp. TRM90224]